MLKDPVATARFALHGLHTASEAGFTDVTWAAGVDSFTVAAGARQFFSHLFYSGSFARRAHLDTVVSEVLCQACVGLRKIDRHSQADIASSYLADTEGSSVRCGEVRGLVFLEHVLIKRKKAFVLLKDLIVTFVGHRLVKLGLGTAAL